MGLLQVGIYPICQVTSSDHLIERACKIMSENSFCYVVKLISLVTISIVIVEMFLICHVTSREHMFEGLCEFMAGSSSVFDGHWSSASGDINYLTCHVALQNSVTEGSRNFKNGSSSWYITTLLSLVAIAIVVVGMFLVCHTINQDHIIKGSGDYNDKRGSQAMLSRKTTWSKRHVTLSAVARRGELPFCRIWWL